MCRLQQKVLTLTELLELALFTNKVAGQRCCLTLVLRQSWQVGQLGVSRHGSLHHQILLPPPGQ